MTCRPCRYIYNVLLAVDQLASALVGGDPDETLSSRFGRAQRAGKRWAKVVCRVLDVVHPGHCEWAIEHDEGRAEVWRWH